MCKLSQEPCITVLLPMVYVLNNTADRYISMTTIYKSAVHTQVIDKNWLVSIQLILSSHSTTTRLRIMKINVKWLTLSSSSSKNRNNLCKWLNTHCKALTRKTLLALIIKWESATMLSQTGQNRLSQSQSSEGDWRTGQDLMQQLIFLSGHRTIAAPRAICL